MIGGGLKIVPNLVVDLLVDRVDLVEEGANSAAFIELYKRKEPKQMELDQILSELKPEHAEVIKSKISELDTVQEELKKAKGENETLTADLEKTKESLKEVEEKLSAEEEAAKSAAFDDTETLVKSLPKEVQEYVSVIKAKQLAAEEEVRKANEAKATSEAIAKAATLKSLPVEQEKLVSILKGASPDVVSVLETINNAIDVTVLSEVGKSAGNSTSTATDANTAWNKIEAEAAKIVKSAGDKISKQKAIAQVIKEKPELYREYLEGGAE